MAINTGMGNYAAHRADHSSLTNAGLGVTDRLQAVKAATVTAAIGLAISVGTLVGGLHSSIGADPTAQSVVAGIHNEHIQQIGAAFAPVNNGGPAPEMGPQAPMQRARPVRGMRLG